MRKRDRDEVSAAARRRLSDLSAELAALRREQGVPTPQVSGARAPGVAPAARKPPAPAELRARAARGASSSPRSSPSSLSPLSSLSSPLPATEEPSSRAGRWLPAEDTTDDELGESFLERPEPLLAGTPAGLFGEGTVIRTPVGRPLPPDPARVPAPGRHGRHVVDRTGPSAGEWVEERMPSALRGRIALSGQHLVVLSGLLGVALVLAGWLALRSGSEQERVPQARFVAQQTEPSSSPTSAASRGTSDGASAAVATAGADVVVDVVGKVRRPGIVTLPTGSRVNDAVVKAGGLRAGAHTESLNLARVLVDGEQIVVGQGAQGAAPVAGAVAGASAAPGAAAGALVNINTAGLSELDELPGVGPVTAQKIVDWRTAHGAFTSVDELLEVDGIGDKTLADIAPQATL